MALRINPGIAIALFLNVILLLGIPFFGDLKNNGMIVPLIGLALVWPWVMAWAIGRAMAWVARESARRQEEKDNSDFV